MSAYEHECIARGLDPTAVASLARRFTRLAKEAKEMGLFIFGGSGSGTLRMAGEMREGATIVAELGGQNWDGGDGATHIGEDGLLRGEDA